MQKLENRVIIKKVYNWLYKNENKYKKQNILNKCLIYKYLVFYL